MVGGLGGAGGARLVATGGVAASVTPDVAGDYVVQLIVNDGVVSSAPDTPVIDHPVSCEMGRRKTGSENMAPIATQPNRPPAATITQR